MLWFLLLLRHAIVVLIVLASCLIFNVKTLIVYCYLCSILSSRNYRYSLVCLSVCLSASPSCELLWDNNKCSHVFLLSFSVSLFHLRFSLFNSLWQGFSLILRFAQNYEINLNVLFGTVQGALLPHQLKLLKNNVRIKVFNDVFLTCRSTETFTEYCFL